MASFGDYLNKYGVKWEEKLLGHWKTVWPNRGGSKLTGYIVHTEGAVQNIPGTADRDVFNYFNNPNNPCTNGFVTFSGKFIIYIPIENGSTGTGDRTENAQTYQVETQDNGRFKDSKTYTDAQYRTHAGILCALKDWTKDHEGPLYEIQFDRTKKGIRRHNEVNPGRECPGALNPDRIMNEAKKLWDQINNNSNNQQIMDEINRLNEIVKQKDMDIERISDLNHNQSEQILNLEKSKDVLAAELLKKKLALDDIQRDFDEVVKIADEAQRFKSSIFYLLFKLIYERQRNISSKV